MRLSFDDTQRAFAHKSDFDLKKAYRLFQTFSSPFLVKYGARIATTALDFGLPIKKLIKKTIFHQFCGGESIEESSTAALRLFNSGIGAILDYSVEGEGNEKSYKKTFEELKKVIQVAGKNDEYPFAVFKCTGIGSFNILEQVSSGNKLNVVETGMYKEFVNRVHELCKLAHENEVKLLIDAEESWIQKAVDDLVYGAMAVYNKDNITVYNTIQLYQKGRVEEIEQQIVIAKKEGYKIGLKLVRGAYMEKEAARAIERQYDNPIQDSKEDTDRDYDKALQLCFDNKDYVAIVAGTHNEESSYKLARLIDKNNIDKTDDRFWFAQLYGMSDHISYNLATEGFNVAKYLPYGPVKEVLPYLSRRAQENSSVKGQSGRELSLIIKEIKRRRSA